MRRRRKPPREKRAPRRSLRRRRIASPKEEYQQAVDEAEVLSEKLSKNLASEVRMMLRGLASMKEAIEYLENTFEDYSDNQWEVLLEPVMLIQRFNQISSTARNLAIEARSTYEDYNPMYNRLVDAEELMDEKWEEWKSPGPSPQDRLDVLERG